VRCCECGAQVGTYHQGGCALDRGLMPGTVYETQCVARNPHVEKFVADTLRQKDEETARTGLLARLVCICALAPAGDLAGLVRLAEEQAIKSGRELPPLALAPSAPVVSEATRPTGVCRDCGNTAEHHPFRHPFVAWVPGDVRQDVRR
jgi:hypothetical protein